MPWRMFFPVRLSGKVSQHVRRAFMSESMNTHPAETLSHPCAKRHTDSLPHTDSSKRELLILEGTKKDDVLIHDGWGELHGGKGEDILIGERPQYFEPNEPFFKKQSSPCAQKKEQLLLDGGVDDDWIVVFGGEKAIAVGGMGKDWIFNHSSGGVRSLAA